MRRLILLGLIAVVALPAVASRRMTVAQLGEALAADNAVGRADAQVARQVGEFELTERLTDLTLGHLAARLTLGPRTALALQLLADQSAFLDPPAGELPATALPDAATRQRMMDAARGYVVQTWPRLPNFFVTRVTHRFDDSPQILAKGDWPVRAGLHLVGAARREVTFRDGKEVQDPTAQTAADEKTAPELGLRTWGEFGPALSVVLADVARGTVAFSHWEQTEAGLAAVYHYSVPKAASHYAVSYCCLVDQQLAGRVQFGYSGRNRSAQQMANIPRTDQYRTFSETPGYHGAISIDPATGAVLRITIEAELSNGDPLMRAGTMVEYGPVTIGDRHFICPLRSLAISVEPAPARGAGSRSVALNGTGDDSAWESPLSGTAHAPVLLINETSFTNYHRLGTTMRIVTNASAAEAVQTGTQAPAPPNPGAGTASAPPSAPPAAQEPAPVTAPQASETAASNAPPPPATEPAGPPPPPAEPLVPEISLSPATALPDQPANAPQPAESSYSLKVTSRLVDVGVVAYDKKGHPVNDLQAGDFEVYDNGRKQEIRFFNQAAGEAQAAPAAAAEAEAPQRSFSNRAPDAAGPASTPPASEAGATILLIDESHIAWNDMNNARRQMIKFLDKLAPGERVGLYSMTSLGFRVLNEITTDHAALTARLQKLTPSAQSVSQAQDEETRNRQHFDEVHNVADLNSVNGNHTEVPDSSTPVDPQLLTMGSNPARASLIILAQVARHLSALPGHKSLVWVSSDNVLADWQDQAVAIDKSPTAIDSYALRAQEAMNDAHAAVYPFDVSQLESGAITADLEHQNVQLTPAAAEAASLGGGQTMSRSTSPGRVTAAMDQDLHPVQGPVRQLAAATGGRVIRRAGDLAAALSGIVEDGRDTYMLSFAPQGPADGQYHLLTVKLTGRRGLSLRYRTGYLFDKEPATLKERFQQAVWRPMDVSEIAVKASVAPSSAGGNVKINIAAGDLGLQQQAGRWMDKLDIFFIQRDDAGLRARVEGQTLGLRLKSATYQSLMPGGIPFEQFVQIQPGMASLRVLVVDENSGRMGSVTMPAGALGAAH
ncbi:MAG: VWA domain-containing protein [Terracidiphilus sp.]